MTRSLVGPISLVQELRCGGISIEVCSTISFVMLHAGFSGMHAADASTLVILPMHWDSGDSKFTDRLINRTGESSLMTVSLSVYFPVWWK